MLDFDELNKQNHKIAELSRVLSYLIKNRLICDTTITCTLFFEYIDFVTNHLEVGDRGFYKDLVSHPDPQMINLAHNFMNGSMEIKRIFKQYPRQWCNLKKKTLKIRDHQAFINDSNEMFETVLNRIQDEQEKLYPLLRKIWLVPKAA